MDQVREKIRLRHYSIRTEEAYVGWIKRYIYFHNKQHPKDLGRHEIEAFLTHLAVQRKVAASTQNQAFNSLLFLYTQVLEDKNFDDISALRAKQPERLPIVLSPQEVSMMIDALIDTTQCIVKLICGVGLRGIFRFSGLQARFLITTPFKF